ncbi:response regulator [Cohnella nanjingensis]|uniref:Response regulator n=1 Tax=Cohnella nanjingensis TaxID=1387779 RepID=A0A7X0RNI7_9BACL|nr:response regulator [Cohnella nanjingensis]MBB6670700.1 response regulator [Cohnella nanjingensis]
MYKVLLVDDEVYVRTGLRRLIPWKEIGYEICGEAGNGAAAMEMILTHRPDLVITDIRMPVLDGLELIRRSAEAGRPSVAFLIMSGHEDFKYAQMAVRYGVSDYLLKPVDEDELQAALRKLTNHWRARESKGIRSMAAGSAASVVAERMEENDREAIRQAVERLADELDARHASEETIRRTVGLLVSAVAATIEGMDGSVKSLRTLDRLEGGLHLPRATESWKPGLLDFALEGAALIDRLRRERLHGGIHRIKAHIERHYREEVSLKRIAAHFYMNPVYVGQLFRKTYGVYFNEFVLGLRVREAKRLLRLTELRVYEVAERVGFGRTDYFITQFEKLEGMTPAEYRGRLLRRQGTAGGAHDKTELE